MRCAISGIFISRFIEVYIFNARVCVLTRVRKFVTLMSALYQFEVTDKLKSDVMVMSLRRQNVTLFVIFKISD